MKGITDNCVNCMAWSAEYDKHSNRVSDIGSCRYDPPKARLDNSAHLAVWPQTHKFSWCLKHVKKS